VRIVYLGSPQIAVPPLRALVGAGHEVVLVVSNPDRRRGRGGVASPTPVALAATELGLTVTDDPLEATNVGAELGVVVAYGRILSSAVLDALPVVNLHFSLLPRWRGAAPVERAILAGDDVTGVCLMEVEPTLDTGPVHAAVEHPIGPRVTAAELSAELSRVGADLLVDALRDGIGPPTPQSEEGVTYAAKLSAADRRLDWSLPAEELDRIVRVGGAWTTFRGRRLGVVAAVPSDLDATGAPVVDPGALLESPGLRVRCGDGAALDLLVVRPEGRSDQDAASFTRGYRPDPGERLGG
jgi:methionyl-tRNA formyltransferase